MPLYPPAGGGGGADIPLSTITAAGQLIVGTGAGAVDALDLDTPGYVLTDVAGTPAWAPPSGGGSTITRTSGWLTSPGSVTLPSTGGTWQALSGFTWVSPSAAVDDWLEFDLAGLRSNISTGFLDIGVVVSGAPVWFASNGTGTPCAEGIPDYYGAADVEFRSAPIGLKVASGHLSSGVVTFQLYANAQGSGTIFASTTYPIRWIIKNYGDI